MDYLLEDELTRLEHAFVGAGDEDSPLAIDIRKAVAEIRALREQNRWIPVKCAMSASGNRVETGVLQFKDDWPGVFIRGDAAIGLATALRYFLETQSPQYKNHFEEYIKILLSCDIRNEPEGTNPTNSGILGQSK